MECFTELLNAGANVDEFSDEGCSALIASATRYNKKEFMKLLLEKGADINLTKMEFTVVGYAVKHCPEMIPFLLEHNPDLNLQSETLRIYILTCGKRPRQP
jgi:hypothetical protein